MVSNGVALCKLHHAAFDRFFFAIRPDWPPRPVRRSTESADTVASALTNDRRLAHLWWRRSRPTLARLSQRGARRSLDLRLGHSGHGASGRASRSSGERPPKRADELPELDWAASLST